MKLQDVFDTLTGGEFSQLAIGGQDMGVINDANYRQVLGHINLGLTSLFRRFNLKESYLVLSLQPNQTTYYLQPKYAVSNRHSREAVRYILDGADAPFREDTLLKVQRVLTDAGDALALNDVANPFSVLTPSLTTLMLPDALAYPTSDTPDWLRTPRLKVYYRANHAPITVGLGLFNPANIVLDLPYSHLEALCYFVASRVNNPIGMSNEFHAGNNYAAKYEAACLELENLGLEVDYNESNLRLCRKGFV